MEEAELTVPRVLGSEGTTAKRGSHTGKCLAVFTSGGDAQGMNAAIRAVVRMGTYLGCRVFFIHEGYEGMIRGNDYICEAGWNDVEDIIRLGGTLIGSARSQRFLTPEGRLEACANLLEHDITNLICIGGDGSLTGADLFQKEWPQMLAQLLLNGKITQEKADECAAINIVGLVGSIDNDFCGTDMTIGTDSALHRIVEAVDAVNSTAQSHQRCFVIEVMGRRCGYLALVAGLATEADWVFMPEWPAGENWSEEMCEKLAFMRDQGQRLNIVIVAEGAIDVQGKPITSNMVRDTIKEKLAYDTRVTVLGHVQRGGRPSAFDRLLGCRMGAEAVIALMDMVPGSQPCVISIDGNQIIRVPLMQCVQLTKKVQKAMNELNFKEAVRRRGKGFEGNLEIYKLLARMEKPLTTDTLSGGHKFRMAVMNVGAPACGMNAAVRSFVRMSIYHNCEVYGVEDSVNGLKSGMLKKMTWGMVNNWVMFGGSFLGTRRDLPDKSTLPLIAEQLQAHHIDGLLIIGNFEAFHTALILAENREQYRSFQIPIMVIPCGISNNVPGSSFSLGSDTALNEICEVIDKIIQSAASIKRRVFIVETLGGYCGYLATLAALAAGADNAYIFEEEFTADTIISDVEVILDKMEKNVKHQHYLVLRCEKANPNYTTDFIEKLFREEGRGRFSTRSNVLGHVQQGGTPSPFDRIQATKLACTAAEKMIQQMKKAVQPDGQVRTDDPKTVNVIGIAENRVAFSCVQEFAITEADFEHRIPVKQWWLKLRPLLRILSKHTDTYNTMSRRTIESRSESTVKISLE